MTPDPLTLNVTLALIAVISVYDIWTLRVRGYTTTISWNLYGFTKKFPIVGVLIGIVVGHLFWPNAAGA